jgi:hypothetical protein
VATWEAGPSGDAPTKETQGSGDDYPITAMCGSSNESFVYCGDSQGSLKIYHAHTCVKAHHFNVLRSQALTICSIVSLVALDPSRHPFFAVAGLFDGRLVFFPSPWLQGLRKEASKATRGQVIKAHSSSITKLHVDSSCLISGDIEGNIVMWDLAMQPHAVNVWRLKRTFNPGAVVGLHLVALNALDSSKRDETSGGKGSRVIKGLRSALTESSDNTRIRQNGHRCLALYGNGLLAAWNTSNMPLDAESFLQTAREKEGQSTSSSPAWHHAHAVPASSAWAWDTSASRCLIISPTGECCLWKLTDGNNTDVLVPAQRGFRTSASNIGRLVSAVHVANTQFWAIAHARAVVLCTEHGPVATIAGDSKSMQASMPKQAVRSTFNDHKEDESQGRGTSRPRSASTTGKIRRSW